MEDVNLEFPLYPKQRFALEVEAQWKMYGGGAGGGKSHLLRVAAIKCCLLIPGFQAYLFRRNYNELQKNHFVGPSSFHVLLSDLIEIGFCKIVDMEIRFANGPSTVDPFKGGSAIYACHCQHVQDVYKWKGPEMNGLFLEEATELEEEQIRFLVSRNRIPKEMPIPDEVKHLFPMMLATTNPTGPSHSFWKSMFIDGKEPNKVWEYRDEDTVRTCAFIPALLRDNPSLDEKEYRASLLFLKRPELIDAMLQGKWDIPLGAFLPECDERKHLVNSFDIPDHWFKFRTFDWGSQAPFAVNWWAVSDGTLPKHKPIPRGSLVCYREWYGGIPTVKNRGLALSNEQIAMGIRNRTPANEIIEGTISDGKPFQATGGLTIAQEFSKYGVPLIQGDNSRGSRIQGAQQLRSRLIGFQNEPAIYFFRQCIYTWRTLTQIQTDPDNIEDAQSEGDDHCYDSVCLACKARPLTLDGPKKEPQWLHEATAGQILKQHFQYKKGQDSARR